MHIPVLQKEVLQYLDPKPNENFIDCTVGEGGHATAILEKNKPNGKLLGIEIDPELYQKLKLKMAEIPNPKFQISNRLILVNDSFVNLKKIVQKCKFTGVSGILFDLGLSSWHLEESERGFTFQKDEPLIMRYDGKENQLTARDILNNWSEQEIEKILKEYSQERHAKRIARKIIEERKIKPIKTTFELVDIIKKATPKWYQKRKLHFAAKTFQALRIAVNEELKNLEIVLPQTLEVLQHGGRLAVISFHSLEDRIVKNFFRDKAKPFFAKATEGKEGSPILKILTKKPMRPNKEEIRINPRSRSAKLRVAIKL